MTHMVIYRSADGQPTYHQAEALEDAVRHVEHLRNSDTGSDARIFLMQEVPIEVKTYYRVEVGVASGNAAPAAAPEAPAAPAPAPPAPEAAAPAPPAPTVAAVKGEPVAAGNGSGRFGLFNKG